MALASSHRAPGINYNRSVHFLPFISNTSMGPGVNRFIMGPGEVRLAGMTLIA